MDILELLLQQDTWEDFLRYKKEHGHLDRGEEGAWRSFIDCESYKEAAKELPLPRRLEINKSGSSKKRVIYSYPEPFNSYLKGIAFMLYRYDELFTDSCYAFRRNRSAGDAIRRFHESNAEGQLWCLKADVSDYFNSIDIECLLTKLEFLKTDDIRLFELFEKMLKEERVMLPDGSIKSEKHGAMAGIPVAPFFANVYLSETDRMFANEEYFRYSDDILILAADKEELGRLREKLTQALAEHGLKFNEKKLHIYAPGETVEFLGFGISGTEVDLSAATKEKLKGKVRRKARALNRWCRKKELPGDRAAKGFIRALNKKLYSADEKAFSWSRWFFPYLTTDRSLKELDSYIQEFIRYSVTGRHYKANYRITYEKMKEWGYKSLVHEWWEYKKGEQA